MRTHRQTLRGLLVHLQMYGNIAVDYNLATACVQLYAHLKLYITKSYNSPTEHVTVQSVE